MGVKDDGIQYAALPFRTTGEGSEVLLVTSRDTGRWVIPKGWPMEGKAPHEAAAQEAFEEAGVTGEVGTAALGVFHYGKLMKSGEVKPVQVVVFPLKVSQELADWPEREQRTRRWFAADEAAGLVAEPDLAAIIRR